jgi:hypothetical protein
MDEDHTTTKTTERPTRKRGKPEKFTHQQVIDALRQCAGVMPPAAEKLGVDRATVWSYCQRHPEIQKALVEIRESMIDVAESHLLIAVKTGKQWAVERVLRTQGRKRGYGDSIEHSGPDGGAIPVNAEVKVHYTDDGIEPGQIVITTPDAEGGE